MCFYKTALHGHAFGNVVFPKS